MYRSKLFKRIGIASAVFFSTAFGLEYIIHRENIQERYQYNKLLNNYQNELKSKISAFTKTSSQHFAEHLKGLTSFNLTSKDVMNAEKILNMKKFFYMSLLRKNSFDPKVHNFFTLFLNRLGGLSYFNNTEIYFNGSECFEKMWDCINNAKSSIELMTYTLRNDTVGNKFLTALIDAKYNRNVNVNILIDGIGSYELSKNDFYRDRLNFISYNKLSKRSLFGTFLNLFKKSKTNRTENTFRLYPWNRLHAKVLVIDNKIGFIGGMNFADGYADSKVGGNDKYHDVHMKIEGPAVRDMRRLFYAASEMALQKNDFRKKESDSLVTNSNNKFSEIEKNSYSKNKNNNQIVQILQTHILKKEQSFKQAFLDVMFFADKFIYITNPLITCTHRFSKLLINARKRNVDVRIITAGPNNDVLFSRPAHHYIYRYFLKHNIRIFEYKNKILHAKTFVVDDEVASVSSSNFDRYSLKNDSEATCFIYDKKQINLVKNHFINDLNDCVEITLSDLKQRNIVRRFYCWISYLITRTYSFPFFQDMETIIKNNY